MRVRWPVLAYLILASACRERVERPPLPFGEAAVYPACRTAFALSTADLNRDGRQDFAVACYQGDEIRVFLGKRDGSFESRPAIPLSGHHNSLHLSDLTGDGIPDLVIRSDDGKLEAEITGYSLLVGNGKGNFSPTFPRMDPRKGEPLFDTKSRGFLSTDLDGDGLADRVRESDSLRILLNPFTKSGGVDIHLASGGRLKKAGTYETGEWPKGIAAGDLDSDGRVDIVTANFASNSLSFLLGTGSGRFEKRPDLPTGDRPTDVAISDFNSDGRADLAVTLWGEGTVRVYLGTSR